MVDEKLVAGATLFKRRNGLPVWLVVKTDSKGQWELPKGLVRRGESSVGSILRAMREDAGLIMEVLEEAGRTTISAEKAIFYLGERISAIPAENVYKQEKWLPYMQAKKSLGLEREKKMLVQANEVLKEWTRRQKS